MKKKIIAALTAVFIILSCIAVPVYADGSFLPDDFDYYTTDERVQWFADNQDDLTPKQIGYYYDHYIFSNPAIEEFSNDIQEFTGLPASFFISPVFDNRNFRRIYMEMQGIADFGLGFYNPNNSSHGGSDHGGGGSSGSRNSLEEDFQEYQEKFPPENRVLQRRNYALPNGSSIVIEEICPHTEENRLYNYFDYKVYHSDIKFTLVSPNGSTVNESYAYAYGNSIISSADMGYPNALIGVDGPKIVDGELTFYLDIFTYLSGGTVFYNVPQVPFFGLVGSSEIVENPDGSVNITGDNDYYNYTLDDAPEDYLQQFIDYTVNNIVNNYGTELDPSVFNKPYDDSSLMSALQSLYAKLQAIYTAINNAAEYIVTELSNGINKIFTFLQSIKPTVSSGVGITKEFLESVFIGTDKERENFNRMALHTSFQTAVRSKFAFISSIRDFIDYAVTAYSDSSKTNVSPSIDFTFQDNSFNINFDIFSPYISTIRFLIAAYLYLVYAFRTYRRIPSYINNGGDS